MPKDFSVLNKNKTPRFTNNKFESGVFFMDNKNKNQNQNQNKNDQNKNNQNKKDNNSQNKNNKQY